MPRIAAIVLFVLLLGTSRRAFAEDGGDPCSTITEEEACVSTSGCYWGDSGNGPACGNAGGPVGAHPGSGDPGGGGGGSVLDPGAPSAVTEAGDGGCSLAARGARAGYEPWIFVVLALVYLRAACMQRGRATCAPR